MSLPPERELIQALIEGIDPIRNRVGFQDDCAVIPMGGQDLVATVDTFSQASHFPPGTPPEAAGHLATAATLSDLAAAGAEVVGLLVGYGFPEAMGLQEAKAVARGVTTCLAHHGGELLGGDTKPRPVLQLAMTALGTTPPGRAMSRSQASPGDSLVLTGPLGGAGAALDRIQEGLAPAKADPLLSPVPRVRTGRALRELGVTCAMDLSDGLADAATAIAEASQAKLVIEGDAIELHPWADEAPERGLAHGLTTGGDYELLVSVPAALEAQALDACRNHGPEPAVVGRVERGSGAVLDTPEGRRELTRGYEHTF